MFPSYCFFSFFLPSFDIDAINDAFFFFFFDLFGDHKSLTSTELDSEIRAADTHRGIEGARTKVCRAATHTHTHTHTRGRLAKTFARVFVTWCCILSGQEHGVYLDWMEV